MKTYAYLSRQKLTNAAFPPMPQKATGSKITVFKQRRQDAFLHFAFAHVYASTPEPLRNGCRRCSAAHPRRARHERTTSIRARLFQEGPLELRQAFVSGSFTVVA
jgi:hypothetical protein